MASFSAFIVATLLAWVTSDTLKPFGVPPLRFTAMFLVWMLTFYFTRRVVQNARPDL